MARPSARLAASLLLAALALGLPACGGEGGGGDPGGASCVTAAFCPGGSICQQATCVAGRCGLEPLPAGAHHAAIFPANCKAFQCDGQGALVQVNDDENIPGDGNACTADSCVAGVPQHVPEAAHATCAQDGGTVCDGAGACVGCLAAADCPGSDTECTTRTCLGGTCGAVTAPFGTPLAEQVPGDCRQAVCGDLGATTTLPLDTDKPVDGNACTQDVCTAGAPSNPAEPARTVCAQGGGFLCDGAGACVECLAAADCPGFDTPCAQRTCQAGRCSTVIAPAGTFSDDLGAGDCNAILCDGAGGAAGQAYDADLPVDGNPCTRDVCTSGAPSNPPEPAGTPCAANGGTICDGAGSCVECNVGADCASGVCQLRFCQAPTCADGVRNGGETGVDCGGGTCPVCGTGQGCLAATDCQSLVCSATTCAAPTCADSVRNGTETDVDCGGLQCRACDLGRACLADRDCATANCAAGTCGPPRVLEATPAAGAVDVAPGTAVTLVFAAPINLSSATVQAAAGPCSGTVQLSADGFITCLGISGRAQQAGNTALAIIPTAPLAAGTYQVRTLAGLSTLTLGQVQPFVHPGFTVAGAGGCAGALVISQVYPLGGVTNASYLNGFVELHNRAAAAVSLAGLSLQLWSAQGWRVVPLSGSMAPGAHFLLQLPGFGTAGQPLPAPDLTTSFGLATTGGMVALVSNALALPSSSCAAASAPVLDALGYGTVSGGAPGCREGTAASAPADAGASVARGLEGCADLGDNSLDFASQLSVARNAASPASGCACNGSAVNETGLSVEMDWCNVQFPLSLSAAASTIAGPVWGRVFESGVTNPAGAPAGILGQLGYGPAGSDPRYAPGWIFVDAAFNAQFGNDDEFQATFTAPAPGSYSYAYRFSPDRQRWTYCDLDGAGASAGLAFEPFNLPVLTVTP